MAALLRGLRAGSVLRALSRGTVTPPCSRVHRGFRQAVRLRLQDDSKSEQLATTATSSSSVAHQQHLQAQPSEQETAPAQDTSAPEQSVPESVTASTPEVEAAASTPKCDASVSPPERDVPESTPGPASTAVQEVYTSASASALEASVHTPKLEASAQEVSESSSEGEASGSEEEVSASAKAASTSKEQVSASASGLEASRHMPELEASAQQVSESAQEVRESASEADASAQAASASGEEVPEPDHSRVADQGGEESNGYETEEGLRARILATALEFVPLHGWSVEAISAGAQALGLSSAAAGMFTNGAGDLVLHFISQCNAELAKMLAEQQNQVQQGHAEPKETADILRSAVEARLRMLVPHIDSWPQAMSILLLPHNIPNSLKHLSTLIDDIWYYAGDRSTDMNWYTRRAALTGVYNTTELVMLQDSSPDFQDTWDFLDKRIQDIVNMADTAKQVQATGEAVVQGIMGAAITLSNLAGMNQRR